MKCKYKPTDINKIPEQIVHAFVQSLNVALFGEMHLGTYRVKNLNKYPLVYILNILEIILKISK